MKDTIQLINERFEEFEQTEELNQKFTSTAVEQNKRVYPLYNTNAKTLNTYSTYLNDILNNPEGDHHQKNRILKKLRAYYSDNDNISNEEKKHIDIRQQIFKKTLFIFQHPSSFIKNFIIFILSLNSFFNPHKSSQEIFDTLDKELKEDYEKYLEEILLDTNIDLKNPIFGVYVLYSDKHLLELYLDLYKQDKQEFLQNIPVFNKNKYVKKRVTNCQKSSLRSEALLFALYTLLDDINTNNNYDDIIKSIVRNLEIMFNRIHYTNISLFHFEDNCFNELKDFLLNLNTEEKEEILLSLGKSESPTSSASIKKRNKLSKTLKTVTKISNGRGYDVITTTKSRRGQNIFKRNLVNSLGEEEHKCAICGCKISGDQCLVASHIYPWKYSNDFQKTDGNNGLLLCPNHDFLFDSLLISFDLDGQILISEDLTKDNCKAFGLHNTLSIDISEEKEVYMSKHRNAFKDKGWENN